MRPSRFVLSILPVILVFCASIALSDPVTGNKFRSWPEEMQGAYLIGVLDMYEWELVTLMGIEFESGRPLKGWDEQVEKILRGRDLTSAEKEEVRLKRIEKDLRWQREIISNLLHCVSGKTHGQILAIMKQWMEKHPEAWSQGAGLGILTSALEEKACVIYPKK